MRRLAIAGLAALGVALLLSAAPVLAQDIYGLSLRPTENLDTMAARGSVDIVAAGDGYMVSVDLSAAVDELDLADYGSAEAFVVWVVDMDGNVTNAGVMDENLVLEDAEVDGVVAKVFVTAEDDADAEVPTGDRLYELTLRNVSETAQPADQDADEATDEDADEDVAEDADEDVDEDVADEDAEGDAAVEGEDEDSKDNEKPAELPTTGGNARDLLILTAVALVLLMGALRLHTLRV